MSTRTDSELICDFLNALADELFIALDAAESDSPES